MVAEASLRLAAASALWLARSIAAESKLQEANSTSASAAAFMIVTTAGLVVITRNLTPNPFSSGKGDRIIKRFRILLRF